MTRTFDYVKCIYQYQILVSKMVTLNNFRDQQIISKIIRITVIKFRNIFSNLTEESHFVRTVINKIHFNCTYVPDSSHQVSVISRYYEKISYLIISNNHNSSLLIYTCNKSNRHYIQHNSKLGQSHQKKKLYLMPCSLFMCTMMKC